MFDNVAIFRINERDEDVNNIFSFCYFFVFVKIRFVKTFHVWKSMILMPAPFSLAAICNRKKVCDRLKLRK